MQALSEAITDEDVGRQARSEAEREQWTLLLQNVRASTLPTALVGAIYAAFFAHVAGIYETWIWWLTLLVVLGLRWWVVGWTQAGGADAFRRRTQWLFALMAVTGAVWGIAPVLIVWFGSEVLVITAIVFATGIAVTGFASYGINRAATICVTAPIAIPSLALLLASSKPSFLAIGVALAFMYTHQFVVVGQTRRMLSNQIRVRVENAILASQVGLQAERTSAELDRRVDMERQLRAARDRAEKTSATDGLTEIANRRYFDRRLKSEVSRAFRDRTSLSLVICDIDYFKQFNDLYGHQRGDECLKSFARVLESFCRRGGDLPARIGGEEFALLLPSTDHEAALRLAEQARGALDGLDIKHEGSEVKGCVTASFGVSTAVPDNMDVGQTLVARADKALYLAKKSGRNRVVSETKLN